MKAKRPIQSQQSSRMPKRHKPQLAVKRVGARYMLPNGATVPSILDAQKWAQENGYDGSVKLNW